MPYVKPEEPHTNGKKVVWTSDDVCEQIGKIVTAHLAECDECWKAWGSPDFHTFPDRWWTTLRQVVPK